MTKTHSGRYTDRSMTAVHGQATQERTNRSRNRIAYAAGALVLVAVGAVPSAQAATSSKAVCDNKVKEKKISAWFHSGTGEERDVLQAQVNEFNKTNKDKIVVKLELIAQNDYTAAVDAAAAAGKLPALLDFDGPLVYNYAWAGNIVPLDSCVKPALKANLLPSIKAQGEYAGKFWSVGQFDSGLGLYASKKALESVAARIPNGPADAWSAAEFTKILKDLQAKGIKQPLDVKLNYGKGEWFTYGFSPVLQSAGSDLVSRSTKPVKADGSINSAASVAALATMKSWFTDGLVNPNTNDDSFVKGEAALSWVGHWQFKPYKEKLGADLLVLPLPKFGAKTVSGQGSWNWGITKTAKDGDAAYKFIEFLMTDAQVLKTANANGAVPGTKTAAEKSENFRTNGPLRLYVDQLSGGYTVPRPQTPAYKAITAAFAEAFANISTGADVKTELDKAAKSIDADVTAKRGYPDPK